MRVGGIVLGVLLLAVILWDTLETIVLPRGATAGLRLTRLFYRATWGLWTWATRLSKRRQMLLSFYGPISLLGLLGVWAVGQVFAFGLIHWGLDSTHHALDLEPGFASFLYYSGVTFFTLGYGDIVPHPGIARFVAVLETGMGFGFMALVIGYLPVLYQAFSRREVAISKMDARAGSPPSAVEMLRRSGHCSDAEELRTLLSDWEHWAADLMESQISYPVLSYYRSQHDQQSWVGSLTTVLDTTALLLSGVRGAPVWQARMTFAMGRHAAVDLCLIFNTPPRPPDPDRLDQARFEKAVALLAEAGFEIPDTEAAYAALFERRKSYEPYMNALARHLRFNLPGWLPEPGALDNWESSAWENGGHF